MKNADPSTALRTDEWETTNLTQTALYQGTTSVVPKEAQKKFGL
jgi:hypothetical protein